MSRRPEGKEEQEENHKWNSYTTMSLFNPQKTHPEEEKRGQIQSSSDNGACLTAESEAEPSSIGASKEEDEE